MEEKQNFIWNPYKNGCHMTSINVPQDILTAKEENGLSWSIIIVAGMNAILRKDEQRIAEMRELQTKVSRMSQRIAEQQAELWELRGEK